MWNRNKLECSKAANAGCCRSLFRALVYSSIGCSGAVAAATAALLLPTECRCNSLRQDTTDRFGSIRCRNKD